VTVSAANGSAVIAGVAVALDGCGVPVRTLTLRTPTLDDVFLHVTGSHFAADTARTSTASTTTTAQEADS
jgi:ABC-2 type transport system ATP-binding protein